MEQEALIADAAILHRNPFPREEIGRPEGRVLDAMNGENLEGLVIARILVELGDRVLDLVLNPAELLAALSVSQAEATDAMGMRL